MTSGNTYQVQVIVKSLNTGLSASDSASFFIAQSPLICGISGGNRTISINSALSIVDAYSDPDINPTQDQTKNIAVSWICLNSLDNATCRSSSGQALSIAKPTGTSFIAQTLAANQTLLFTLIAIKDVRACYSTVSITTTSNNIPLVTLGITS